MGPVLILATLFNLVEKFSGTSGGICTEDEGIGCTMSGGQVMGSLGSPRVSLPGASGVSCPCFHLELVLPDPDKSGPPHVHCHCPLPGGLLVILLVEHFILCLFPFFQFLGCHVQSE